MKIAFFDTKPYDRLWFDKFLPEYPFTIRYIESRLSLDTTVFAKDCDAVCVFVNDMITKDVVDELCAIGIRVMLLRCAGFNNVDLEAAFNNLTILRVPAYSPYAVAEYALALLLSVNRKTHRAYSRTRDYNFSINGLEGKELHGKTAGIVGTGKIGQVAIGVFRALGMNVLAYDPYPIKDSDFSYVSFHELLKKSDMISLHCPLTEDTAYMINEDTISLMKDGAIVINTSRGGLIDSQALIRGLMSRKIGGVGLDVYEEEEDYFFEDRSNEILEDANLVRLMSFPNVIITSHQAFFTSEAMEAIARTTFENLKSFITGAPLTNEVAFSKKEKV